MFSLIVEVNPVILGLDTEVFRNPPRPENQRQPDYMHKFDHNTLFYDVFRDGDHVRFVGPPLLNLKEQLGIARLTDTKGRSVDVQLQDLDRTQNSWAEGSTLSGDLKFESQLASENLTVGQSLVEKFSGKKVLVTKSKDNRLEWIHDWVKFHQATQGIDAVLIYDNNSTSYLPADVLRAIESIDGIDSAVVVPWPFKFGPQGGNWDGMTNAPWDSDYTEYSILEHARHRFLRDSDLVISCDIDELVMADNGQAIHSLLHGSDVPGLSYSGRWIEPVRFTEKSTSETPNFSDFYVYDVNRYPTTRKWAIVPARCNAALQWKTHSIAGATLKPTTEVMHRHFMPISSNWKMQRTDLKSFDPKRHLVDEALIKAMQAAGIMHTAPIYPPTAKTGLANSTKPDLASAENKPLVHLREIILSESFRFPCTRLWFYNENCLTFDTVLNGNSIGFDFVSIENRIEIKAVGRDRIAVKFLADLFACRGLLPKSSKGHYVLASFPSEAASETIFSRFNDQIEWMIHHSRSLAYRSVTSPRAVSTKYPASWRVSKDNFGDLLAPLMVETMTGRSPENIKPNASSSGSKLISIGPLLDLLDDPSHELWGSGLSAPMNQIDVARISGNVPRKIHAVRGWATYRELRNELGWDIPQIFGDPAMLLPRFFNVESDGTKDALLVPPHSHMPYLDRVQQHFKVANMESSAEEIVSQIVNASHVVSASLHGVIVAQAYGVPWTWLRVNGLQSSTDRFEFEDYFSTLDRSAVAELSVSKNGVTAATILRAVRVARLPRNKYSFNRLMDAFPHDL